MCYPSEVHHDVARAEDRTLRSAATGGAQVVEAMGIIQCRGQDGKLVFEAGLQFFYGDD
jgi:hypothetical protein